MTPRFACALALVALTAGCAQPPAAPPVGLLDVAERPAEKALLAGMRAYDDAQYAQAEKQLQAALQAGLAAPRNRTSECEAQFRSARAADPAFALSKSEVGHPLWGPVYQRVQQR